MATESPGSSKTYKTQLGNFTQDPGNIYVSDSVRRDDLVVPAEFSKTGQSENLQLNRYTVVYTEKDALAGAQIEEGLRQGGEMQTSYANNLSLIASFTNATGIEGMSQTRAALSADQIGASAWRSNDKGSGLLQLTTQDPTEYLVDFTGVDRENLNLTDGQIKAWMPSIAAHELYHLKDVKSEENTVLAGEIEADFGSLRDYFNKDYQTFVTDVQALRSMNVIAPFDDHATHIWAEEYEERLPTEDESNKIGKAPAAIMQTAREKMSEAWPEGNGVIDSVLDVPAQKYGALKVLREQGAFDDIPYGNEFVDKYVAAAERRYTPEYLAESNIDKFKELLGPHQPNQPATQNAATIQPMVAPTMAPGV